MKHCFVVHHPNTRLAEEVAALDIFKGGGRLRAWSGRVGGVGAKERGGIGGASKRALPATPRGDGPGDFKNTQRGHLRSPRTRDDPWDYFPQPSSQSAQEQECKERFF